MFVLFCFDPLVRLPAGSGLESPALKQAPGTEVIVLRPAATGMNTSPPQRIAAQLVTSDVILPPQFMKREYSGGSMPSFTTPSQFSAVSGTSGMFSPYVHDVLPYCVSVCDTSASIACVSVRFVFITYNSPLGDAMKTLVCFYLYAMWMAEPSNLVGMVDSHNVQCNFNLHITTSL